MADLEPEPHEPQQSVSGTGRIVLPKLAVQKTQEEATQELVDLTEELGLYNQE